MSVSPPSRRCGSCPLQVAHQGYPGLPTGKRAGERTRTLLPSRPCRVTARWRIRMKLPRRRPRYADIVATVALVLAMSGTAYAVTQIDPDSVYTDAIQNSAVTAAKLHGNSVNGGKVVDGSLGSADIADESLTTSDIADGTVGSADIADGTVGSADIADGTVTSSDLATDSVQATEIADTSIDGGEIIDTSLSATDLAPG